VFFFVRVSERAIAQARATLEMHPLATHALYVLGLAYCMLGRPDQAIPALARATEIAPVPLSFDSLAHACARGGQAERAMAILDRLLALPPGEVSARPLVVIHAALLDTDHAFERLERAFEARDSMLFSLPTVALYDPLRPDPRFADLVARVCSEVGVARVVT
jgi:tetratricopeptide (TPR) repeat protein